MSATIEQILVPIDGSADAVKAATMAAVLARGTGARITLAHVLDTKSMPLLGASAISGEELARATEEAAERCACAVERAALEGSGATYDTTTLRGEPGPEIVRHAQEQGVDLIVMGSRGLSPLRQVLLGSVSSHVLHDAPCSVTVAR